MSDEALETLKRRKLQEFTRRTRDPGSASNADGQRRRVALCMGCCCPSNGSVAIYRRLLEEIHKQDLQETVQVSQTECQGPCEIGPNMVVYPEATQYSRVTVRDVEEIVAQHLKGGRIVSRLLTYPQAQGARLPMIT